MMWHTKRWGEAYLLRASDRVIVVTGATGLLGRATCAAFTAAGYEVRALVRDVKSASWLSSIAQGGIYLGNLPHAVDESAFPGSVAAVIHCAYDTAARDSGFAQDGNLAGTRRVRELAEKHQAGRFVFISSMAAHLDARSVYGKTKWMLEQEMRSARDTVVKPGTILGPGGICLRIREMVRRLPFVPLLYGDRELQWIYIDDTAAGLLRIVEQDLAGEVILAHPHAVPLHRFYKGIIAMEPRGKRLIPFSGDLALAGITVAERLGLRLPISSENLLGIKYLHHFDPQPDLKRLRLQPLDFARSLAALKAHSPGGNELPPGQRQSRRG